MKTNPPAAALGCVIMASGQGKRFGGNKLMAGLGGKPMLAWILDATEGLFSRRVVVTRHADVAGLCLHRGVPVVLHDLPSRSDTVRLGLEAVGGAVSGCLFCPGDQPLLRRETIQAMLLAASGQPEYLWQLRWGDAPGSPVLFPRWAFEELKQLPQGKGGSVLLKKYPELVRFVPAQDLSETLDVDSPGDLVRLARYLEQ